MAHQITPRLCPEAAPAAGDFESEVGNAVCSLQRHTLRLCPEAACAAEDGEGKGGQQIAVEHFSQAGREPADAGACRVVC